MALAGAQCPAARGQPIAIAHALFNQSPQNVFKDEDETDKQDVTDKLKIIKIMDRNNEKKTCKTKAEQSHLGKQGHATMVSS